MSAEHTNEVYLTALAGLLHDIGKFAQRAGVGKREMTSKEALDEVRYGHALYSDSFLQDYMPEAIRQYLSAPRRHHNPQSVQDYRVQLADWLSAAEREEEEDLRVPYLLSPFARLRGHQATACLPLARLDPREEIIFPRPGRPEEWEWRDSYRDEYRPLWGEFTRACEPLKGESDLALYLESLYGLLHEFTWCIPSAWYGAVPDVSLYDHLRTTAAIAACLASDGRDAAWCQEVGQAIHGRGKAEAAAREVCLLVGGDVNGVQAFIYTLASAGAAKGLRARSFYLQLLTEAVARYLLDRLGLPPTNLLYAGGGVFELLAPLSAQQALREARAEVAERLLLIHDGALGLTLEWTGLRADDFQDLRQARGRLGRCLGAGKRRPFATVKAKVLAEHVGTALPFDPGGNVASACQVCGAPGPGEEGKCRFCASLEQDLGAVLPRATHIVVCAVPPDQARRAGHWRDGLHMFGADVRVVDAGDEKGIERVRRPADAAAARIWRLTPAPPTEEEKLSAVEKKLADGEKELLESLGNIPRSIAYRPFAQLTPWHWKKEEQRLEIATFDGLAEESARGIERWGVLRMDVDDLGLLFQRGFERPTLSRIAALSRALQLFFEGYLPRVGEKWNGFSSGLKQGGRPEGLWKAGRRDRLYVQYAGGDDLFVVGAWDALPEFAAQLRQELAGYACGNPAVTMSGGISLADSKYPLYQAAQEAAEAEEAAKQFERADGRRKDALTFLSQTSGWEEFGKVKERAYQLAEWCEKGLAPRALVQLLLSIDAEWRRGLVAKDERGRRRRGKARLYFGRWMWQLVYYLARLVMRKDADPIRSAVVEMQKDILSGGITTVGLTARWAQFLIREKVRTGGE